MPCNMYYTGDVSSVFLNLIAHMSLIQVLCCRMGGIIPPVARDLHKQHIENIVDSALKQAGMSIEVISLADILVSTLPVN
jgi:tRNA A37 threonylcarbamoyltransferase TsaD